MVYQQRAQTTPRETTREIPLWAPSTASHWGNPTVASSKATFMEGAHILLETCRQRAGLG